MGEQVPQPVKRERMERLVELVQRRATERAQRFVGREMEVLVEGTSRTDPTRLRGRTRHNKTVNFDGIAEPGELVEVEIDAATSKTLGGVAAKPISNFFGEASALCRPPLGEKVQAVRGIAATPLSGVSVLGIFGPTGVGKTGVAIALAEELRERGEDPVAISCDALQVYEGLGVAHRRCQSG